MKKLVILLLLLVIAHASFGQDKYCKIPLSEDPSYQYIMKYMPEYYYEGRSIEGDPKLINVAEPLTVRMRVMKNYSDDNTFAYLILQCRYDGDWDTLFGFEIDPLIKYLERVVALMDIKPDDHNYYVFNSQRGIFFKTQWAEVMTSAPYYVLNVSFPSGDTARFINKKQILNFIYKLKASKDYFPPRETDFLFKQDLSGKDWEINDVKEI